eukprot:442812-Pleurochrysis_carterae.AAC.1
MAYIAPYSAPLTHPFRRTNVGLPHRWWQQRPFAQFDHVRSRAVFAQLDHELPRRFRFERAQAALGSVDAAAAASRSQELRSRRVVRIAALRAIRRRDRRARRRHQVKQRTCDSTQVWSTERLPQQARTTL